MQICFNLIASYWRRCMDVLPTGLTYMQTHSCRYSRNKIQAKMQYIHTYTYQTHIRLIANIQVGAIRDILIKLRTNSILDACSSPRYESAYLSTKYITKKRKKNRSLPPITSWRYVFRYQRLYCSRWPIISHFFPKFSRIFKIV